MESRPKVVVTGITGYAGSWAAKLLLDQGKYSVRGTVRDPNDQEKLAPLKKAFGDKYNELEVVGADLMDEKSLTEAVKGATYVFHIASPFPAVSPKDEKEVIEPAVNGTTYIMNAAIAAGVKRVVLTSSSTCNYTYDGTPEVDETNWPTIVESTLPYTKSKILAEKAAWEIYEKNKGKIELVTINPSFIMGPSLVTKGFTSGDFLKATMLGVLPEHMKMYVDWVDVREVAQAHINALDVKDGNRYILSSTNMKHSEGAELLKEDWGKYGYNVVTKESTVDLIYSVRQVANNTKSVKELGIKYRPIRETLNDMVEAMIKEGLIPDLRNK